MKIVGILLLLGGTMGVLYSWICGLKERERKLEEFILFFQKSIGVMETEKIRVIDYFEKYASQELQTSLVEIARRLASNTYPNGQIVWEEVFMEEKQNLSFDQETFSIILQAGNGFFGRSREENIRFLQKTVKELETQKKKLMEKDAKERKVWVPVGMLGAVMLTILFV
ncbi:MAG: stage III sporulation protein AB [Agathobacter sp.]|nr:stage III sporulation protein AB [Agathobacter sp.]